MTENEALNSALEKVKEQKINFGFMERFNVDENCEVMKALEEIQQYRAIGTVEDIQEVMALCKSLQETVCRYMNIGTIDEFKVLKEKSVAKKAEVNEFDYGEGYVCGECESFLHYVDDDDDHIRTNYCCHCGTKIDWQ